MATIKQIEELLENVNINLDKENILYSMDMAKAKKNQISSNATPKQILLTNASMIDFKKLLLIVTKNLETLVEIYRNKNFSKDLLDSNELEYKKALEMSKRYIGNNENVKALIKTIKRQNGNNNLEKSFI